MPFQFWPMSGPTHFGHELGNRFECCFHIPSSRQFTRADAHFFFLKLKVYPSRNARNVKTLTKTCDDMWVSFFTGHYDVHFVVSHRSNNVIIPKVVIIDLLILQVYLIYQIDIFLKLSIRNIYKSFILWLVFWTPTPNYLQHQMFIKHKSTKCYLILRFIQNNLNYDAISLTDHKVVHPYFKLFYQLLFCFKCLI